MKLMLKNVLRIKYCVSVFILLGIIIGLMCEFDHKLSISRTVCFMPFFLMGYYANENTIHKIRNYRIPLAITSTILLVIIFIFWTQMFQLSSPVKLVKMLYMSGPYLARDLSKEVGLLMRTIEYGVAILLGAAIISITPSQKIKWLGQIGINTLAIYIGHTYLVSILYKLVPHWNGSLAGNVALLIGPLFITLFLSLNFFSRWMDHFLVFMGKVLFKKQSI